MTRLTWDEYWLGGAAWASSRSDCVRLQVGAVVVMDNEIVTSGYNGAPPGAPGCETCPRRTSEVPPGSSYDTGPGQCVAVHAEQNALQKAGLRARGATLYVTCPPCDGCKKMIAGAGIERVVIA